MEVTIIVGLVLAFVVFMCTRSINKALANIRARLDESKNEVRNLSGQCAQMNGEVRNIRDGLLQASTHRERLEGGMTEIQGALQNIQNAGRNQQNYLESNLPQIHQVCRSIDSRLRR